MIMMMENAIGPGDDDDDDDDGGGKCNRTR